MIGTQLSGRYTLERKLGSGGMSTVYLALDDVLHRQVAIKVMHREISDDPDQLERFSREARAVAQLSHPNLVGVIDAGQDQGHPYIVFEYVPGETLKKRIDDQGRLGLDEAVAYAIEIGRGLAHAHTAKLIHRDVKPQNVLIDAEGRAKITDFGIARSLETHGLTATGRVLGTTDYVSPEQAMGKEVDPRTDVYSLGIVLYEMLTGDVPFHAETQVGVAMKHVNDAVPNVQRKRPETSSTLAATLERATAKNLDDRYPGMGEFLADLETALEVEVARAGHSTGEATTVLKSVPGSQRRILTPKRVSWATAIILLGAAIAALSFAALTGEEGPSKQAPEVAESTSEPIKLTAAADYDPAGDQREHDDEVQLAIDSNPRDTAWSTETYDAGLGAAGDKPGVGLIFDAGETVEATELVLTTPISGWTADVYGSESEFPPTLDESGSPDGKRLAKDVRIDSDEQAIELKTGQARYFLVWITQLVPVPDESGFRVEISDARLLP